MKNHYYFGHVDPWWDDSFKSLDYAYLPIKNTWDEQRWLNEGYRGVTLNGALYGMPNPLPEYAQPFLNLFSWSNVGLGFFRMKTLEMFPVHQDHYISYQKKFNIVDTSVIWRCVVFLEDWKSGHYFEIDGRPRLEWRAGDYVAWNYDVAHFAGNFGVEPRYTMQITGSQQ
jgi:hypothetical protein